MPTRSCLRRWGLGELATAARIADDLVESVEQKATQQGAGADGELLFEFLAGGNCLRGFAPPGASPRLGRLRPAHRQEGADDHRREPAFHGRALGPGLMEAPIPIVVCSTIVRRMRLRLHLPGAARHYEGMPMAKKADRDDDLPDFLFQISEEQEEAIRDSLPDDVPDLGRMEMALRPPLSYGYSPWVWLLVAALFLVWVAVIPMVLANQPPQGPDAASERRAANIALIACAVLGGSSLLVALFLMTRPWCRRGELWLLSRDGVVRTRWGRNPVVFPWKGLIAFKVFAGPTAGTYEFRAPDVEPVQIRIGGILSRHLPETILDRHILALGPGTLRAVEAGRPARFGPFTVGADGLAYEGKEVPWEEITRVEAVADSGHGWKPRLQVYAGKKKPWADADVSERVPNAWLMMWLVRKLEKRVVKDFESLKKVLC